MAEFFAQDELRIVADVCHAGGYKVTWKAMSKDGHVVNGVYAYTVGGK